MRQSTVKNRKRGPRTAVSPFAAMAVSPPSSRLQSRGNGRAGGAPCAGAEIPVIVVDDGSTDGSMSNQDIKGIVVLRHKTNREKGAALLSGFTEAARLADWALTIDADASTIRQTASGSRARFLPGRARLWWAPGRACSRPMCLDQPLRPRLFEFLGACIRWPKITTPRALAPLSASRDSLLPVPPEDSSSRWRCS
jgi:hypothetical protein